MRTSLAAFALILAACSPATPPASETAPEAAESEPQTPQHPDTAALSAAPASGQWFEGVEAGTFSAGFGLPNSEYQFRVTCTAPASALTLYSSHALAPDQATTLRLITATQSIELPAQSTNLGLPSISAEIGDDDPLKPLLIGMLGTPTDRFAVEAGGETSVFPWDESVARTLIACQ